MTLWRWIQLGVSVIISAACIVALNWVSDFLYRRDYPTVLAVDVPGFEGPLVNRAVLQRSWPRGLNDLGSRAQLRAYMGDVEDFEAPTPTIAVATETSAPAPEPDLATLLASADVASGERRARVCAACHTFDEGGGERVGPNLWGVIGRNIGARPSYDYSDALASEPGSWTIEKINAYLRSPDGAIPGNKMAFQGVRRARDRADIIAYLRMQGSDQIPLP